MRLCCSAGVDRNDDLREEIELRGLPIEVIYNPVDAVRLRQLSAEPVERPMANGSE